MNGDEAAAFVTLPHANDAVSLRLWDDEAKQAGLDVPGLDAYIPYLQRRLMRAATRL
jgi:predicted HD phosphohydrolase